METTWKFSHQSIYKRALWSDGVTSSAEAFGSVSVMEPLYRLSLKICSLTGDAANISHYPADHTHTHTHTHTHGGWKIGYQQSERKSVWMRPQWSDHPPVQRGSLSVTTHIWPAEYKSATTSKSWLINNLFKFVSELSLNWSLHCSCWANSVSTSWLWCVLSCRLWSQQMSCWRHLKVFFGLFVVLLRAEDERRREGGRPAAPATGRTPTLGHCREDEARYQLSCWTPL